MSENATSETADASDDTNVDQDESVLSDAEVGALLEGVADGVVPTGGGVGKRREITEFSFADNAHVSSYCPASLVTLYDKLMRRIRDDLRQVVRGDVAIELDALRRYRYDDYVAGMTSPVSIHVLREPNLPDSAMMVFDGTLIGALVDRYYGGGGPTTPRESGTLTAVELRMADTCVRGFLQHVNEIWSTVTPVMFTVRAQDTAPKLVSVAGPSDPMLVARFRVQIDDLLGEHHLVMPLTMIAPMRAALAASGQGRLDVRAKFQQQVQQHLKDVPVDLVATLSEFDLSLRDVVAMSPGDVLPIDVPQHAVLRIDGADVLHGRFGRSRGVNAVSIAKTGHNETTSQESQ